MKTQLSEIQSLLKANAKPGSLVFFQKIIPGKQKIYGVTTPVLHDIVKKYQAGSFELATALWESGAHEEKIIAIKILEKKGKQDPERLFSLFKTFSRKIDNWAVCDGLGMHFLRGIVKTHASQIFGLADKFSRSKDPWQRRLSLVMIEWYTRDRSHHAAINEIVKRLEDDDEYYVKKAVAWIKRNFQKNK